MNTPPSLYSEVSSSLEKSPTHSSVKSPNTESFQAFSFSGLYKERKAPSPDIDNHVFHQQSFNYSPFVNEAPALQQRLEPSNDEDNSSKKHIGAHVARPFKAYAKKLSSSSDEEFEVFRQEKLKQILDSRGGQFSKSNPKMRRNYEGNRNVAANDAYTNNSNSFIWDITRDITNNSNSPTRDSTYYERRQKNNAAAKQSRDRRRFKEDEIALRTTFLENQNLRIRAELAVVKRELTELKFEQELDLEERLNQLARYKLEAAALQSELNNVKKSFQF